MSVFSRAELESMRNTQIAHYNGTVSVERDQGSADVFGNPDPAWSEVYRGECGFHYRTPNEVLGSSELPTAVAELRLPVDADVSEHDRVTLLEAWGMPFIYRYYVVDGPPIVGGTGTVVRLSLDRGRI